jgi:hypothetical protein
MKTFLIAASSLALLSAAAPAMAHHSGAMFDRNREKVITGTVRDFQWTNPHASFAIDVPDAGGQPSVWQIEMNSPNNLVADGWKRSTLKVGDKVSVGIHPLRDGRPGGSYVGITLPDGKRLGAEPGSAQ